MAQAHPSAATRALVAADGDCGYPVSLADAYLEGLATP